MDELERKLEEAQLRGETAVMEILLMDVYKREGRIRIQFDASAWAGLRLAVHKQGLSWAVDFIIGQIKKGLLVSLEKVKNQL